MESSIDYSQNSLQELTDAARYIDREKYPDQYKQVAQELERRGGPPPAPTAEKEAWAGTIPSMVRYFSHILGGFVGGLLLHTGCAFIIATNVQTKAQAEPAAVWQFISLVAILAGSTIYGVVRAVRQSVNGLSWPWAIIGLLFLGTALGICDLLIMGFTALMSMGGYC